MREAPIATPDSPAAGTDAGLTVLPLHGRGDLWRFIRFPERIYADDAQWVAPLRIERYLHLTHNPYFQHARWQGWLAWRDGRVVGRISAQECDLHQQTHGDDVGFFGQLEAVDDGAVFAALLDAASDWLRARGKTTMRGPFSLSINDECGLLVEGFDTPPVVFMGHARPYYQEQLARLGMNKAMDLLAYWIAPDFAAPRVMRSLLDYTARRATVRPLNKTRMDDELALLRGIFNDAWADNWGFVPFTEAEFAELGQLLRWILDPRLVQIAEIDGEPAAMIVVLPNVNEILRDLHGRLLPLGWWRLLRGLVWGFPGTARVALMGVRRKFQGGRLGPGLAYSVIDAARWPTVELGVTGVEMSWILETNKGMRNIIEGIGSRCYKRYRIYESPLK